MPEELSTEQKKQVASTISDRISSILSELETYHVDTSALKGEVAKIRDALEAFPDKAYQLALDLQRKVDSVLQAAERSGLISGKYLEKIREAIEVEKEPTIVEKAKEKWYGLPKWVWWTVGLYFVWRIMR